MLGIILWQHVLKWGCFLVCQSCFHKDPKNLVDVKGFVIGCKGFHSGFRTAQDDLSLNINVSTTVVIPPRPVVDFLLVNPGC